MHSVCHHVCANRNPGSHVNPGVILRGIGLTCESRNIFPILRILGLLKRNGYKCDLLEEERWRRGFIFELGVWFANNLSAPTLLAFSLLLRGFGGSSMFFNKYSDLAAEAGLIPGLLIFWQFWLIHRHHK